MSRSTNKADTYEAYVRVGKAFACCVSEALARETIDPTRDRLFIYSTGALEAIHQARELGLRVVLDQLDPAQLDEQMVNEEIERWPGWETSSGAVPEAYYERLRREWEAADVVVVNSEWSKQAILDAGVDPERVQVIPLAYELDVALPTTHGTRSSHGPLRVLWLGQVILRKGIPYLVEAARRLPRVAFDVVGPVGISEMAVRSAPPNIAFHGKVSRAEVERFYTESDVFVLPTLSDGFAITQLEAMAHGLPVIATAHCGEVVTDGVDGFVVPIRDPEALAERISGLDRDRHALAQMQVMAATKVRRFSVAKYIEDLMRASDTQAVRG